MKIKDRIQFIDIAKGIAIFLVVWGHTATNQEQLSPDCPLVIRILYAFHMPLFFFLSGLSMSTTPLRTLTEWRAFFKKNILTVAFPFFIWALIYCRFTYGNFAWICYGSWQALGMVESLTSLWFLPTLFVGKILVEIMVSYTGQKAWTPIALVFLAIGIMLPSMELGYPWCFNVGCVAASCIAFGMILKIKCIELSVQKLSLLSGLLIASVALFALTIVIDGNDFTISLMCKNQYGTGIFPIVRAITGSMAILTLAMILRQLVEEKSNDKVVRTLIYLGQYTIGIFILHKPFLQQVVIPVMTSLTGDVLSVQTLRFISAAIAMTATLPVCNIIMYYVPELIGIFTKDKLSLHKN